MSVNQDAGCRIRLNKEWTAYRGDFIRVVLLAILTGLIWCAFYDRWTMESWQTPTEYLGDPEKSDVISLFAAIKAAGNGDMLPLDFSTVTELGAPHVAHWDDYPTTEKPLLDLTGWLSRILGIFAAANVALMLAFVLAAISFYAAARLLGGSRLWAGAGALVFAFARYTFAQGLHHLTVTYYWHVPLCLVVVIWIFGAESIRFGTGRFRFALFVALITGVQNIYYTNMFIQFVALGGLLQGWRRGWRSTLPELAIIAAAAGAFLLMNANTFAYSLVYGGNDDAVVRSYRWLEIYGLKLVDLVVPPPDHPFPPFAAWGAAHLKEIVLSPGELPPSAYLGLAGLSAMAWLVIDSVRSVVKANKMPLEAWLMLWIVLYAEVGGLNSVAGTLGFQLFRATTRYSIFILALVLIYAVRRLSMTAWMKTPWTYGAAILLSIVAVWDQSPPLVSASDLQATARDVASDRAFTEKMEAQLPAQAMVFQIPVMDFPESPAPGIGAYDHFRPYLYAQHLRFSFGSDKGRPQDQWQHDLARLPLADVIDRLESYGFGALYINLNGFQNRGADIIKALKDQGRTNMFFSDNGDLLCVLLKPAPQPIMPDGY
jgi:hypothetical protein